MRLNHGRLTFIYFFTLSKGIYDAQSFLGYVLSTKLSFRILFPLTSCAHPSQESMMNRRQTWVANKMRNVLVRECISEA